MLHTTRARRPRTTPRRVLTVTWVAAVAVILGVPSCGAPVDTGTAPHSVGDPIRAAAPPGVRWPAFGALFGGPPDNLGDHYCSASVIDSPAGTMVLTAAHCVASGDGTPARTGMSFVPGYHDHTEPYGAWTVTAAAVDDTWRDHADPNHDVAFLTVTRNGSPPIEQITGGYHLVVDPGSTTTVDALGYPDTADTPTQRSGTTIRLSATQLQLNAHGLYDGTSGGPWLRHENSDATADRDVIAVTGGYMQGGVDPDTSYATYLGDDAAALFRRAGGTTEP